MSLAGTTRRFGLKTVEETPEALTPANDVTPKSARTKGAIIDAALRLFRERGYEATTMRAIAAEAEVSLGNAYYYFKSKEHLIQAFYDRTQLEHAEAAAPVLEREEDLAARIVGVSEAWVDAMEPYRAFAGTFFKNAADPTSPLSPFSLESADARRNAIALWQRVIEGSDAKVPKKLRGELPELLWLYFMGTVLYWVHDRTENANRTRVLIRRTAPIVEQAIGFARLPVFRSILNEVVTLIADLTSVDAAQV